MEIINKPPTLRSSKIKELIRVRLMSNHLWDIPKEELTLDIGCGWGFSLKINPNFYCVDGDKNCIDYLQNKGANAWLVNIVEPLPFDTGYFDNAFTHDVCEHLDENEML